MALPNREAFFFLRPASKRQFIFKKSRRMLLQIGFHKLKKRARIRIRQNFRPAGATLKSFG
jgi:hypothetical protein